MKTGYPGVKILGREGMLKSQKVAAMFQPSEAFELGWKEKGACPSIPSSCLSRPTVLLNRKPGLGPCQGPGWGRKLRKPVRKTLFSIKEGCSEMLGKVK